MEITVDTGVKEFNIGGKVSVYFNPSDATFAQRIYDTFKDLETKQDEYIDKLEHIEEVPDILAFGKELDEEMRMKLNTVFGTDVVTPLIGDCNVYALAGGYPIWANLLTAVLNAMDETVKKETQKSKQKIEKYTNKYAK